jgi:hypothetical protein
MIKDNNAALIVSSMTHSVAEVSSRLDLRPTYSHEIGEQTDEAQTAPPGNGPRFERDSRWILRVEDDDPDDETGFGSMRKLLGAVAGREGKVRALRPDFAVSIQWTGYSDDETGGFVIPADLLAGLAHLECPIVANAVLIAG